MPTTITPNGSANRHKSAAKWMSWRGISPSKSAAPPAVELVPMTTKWQIAKDTAAKVTVDFDRDVEAKRRRSSKTCDLGIIEPVLGVKAFLFWFEHCQATANQVSVRERIP